MNWELETEEMTEKEENKENSAAVKKRRRAIIISVAVVIAAAVVIISAVTALRGRDSMQIAEPVYTCINGMKISWPGGVNLTRQDDITSLDDGSEKRQLSTFPLIKEDGTIVLQRTYSWNKTSDNVVNRVDYFSELKKTDTGVRMERRGKAVDNANGFLYDNKDTYIFLEPAALYIGNDMTNRIEIEPMTIVQVRYKDYIQIFGPDTEPVWLEDIDTDEVTAVFESAKRVNMAIDQLYMKNGSWRLLSMPLDALKEMGTGGDDK